jgi:hypothetical protein
MLYCIDLASETSTDTSNFDITITGSIPLLVDLVPKGTIRPVVSVSMLTWFISYIYWNSQFSNIVIIITTNVLLPQQGPGWLNELGSWITYHAILHRSCKWNINGHFQLLRKLSCRNPDHQIHSYCHRQDKVISGRLHIYLFWSNIGISWI